MKTMLIVDDVEMARTVIKTFLSELDVKVIGEADNGKEAVEKYKEFMPDIVIMDIVMHEMNGIEALRDIMRYNPKAAVIVISSLGAQKFHLYEAKELGAKAVLKKPLQKDLLIAEVKKLLG